MIYRYISKYRFPVISLGISMLGLISLAVWVLVELFSSSQPQILQYANSLGIFRIGTVWDILMLILTVMVFVAANYFLAISLYDRSKFLSSLTSAVSLILSSLIFIAVSAMIGVN